MCDISKLKEGDYVIDTKEKVFVMVELIHPARFIVLDKYFGKLYKEPERSNMIKHCNNDGRYSISFDDATNRLIF